MIGLVYKRHPAPGWVVLAELANSTGGNVRGFADAFVFGIWPSHKYESHMYEFKISRNDLKKELADPSKGDTVGKFADYRWLVISEEKLIDTLVIPEGWGILVPQEHGKATVLRVLRKAPKQQAVPWTRGFVAAVVRHIHDNHVTKAEYNRVREDVHQELRKKVEREVSGDHARVDRAHTELLKAVNDFREKSGIDVVSAQWSHGDIAGAVRLIVNAQMNAGVQGEFLRLAEAHERVAATAREVAALLVGVEASSKGDASEISTARKDELPGQHEDDVVGLDPGAPAPEAG